MPSQAHVKFVSLLARAALLSAQASKLKRKVDGPAKVVFLHAGLATQVAAWDVYVKALTSEYFLAIANASDVRYMSIHGLFKGLSEEAKKKLNTPDSEKSRDFLMTYTNFDPWPCWAGNKFGSTSLLSTLHVRNRLDEIFKVRHSFAHGFSMPGYSWNQNSGGAAHLTCATVKATGIFFAGLGARTDKGMALHIAAQHGIPCPW